jgi:hypothetical protein
MTTTNTVPAIIDDLWFEEIEQAYYTVNVYKYSGLGSEGTFENILADSPEDATTRVANSKPWLRLNPMYAYKQDGRI